MNKIKKLFTLASAIMVLTITTVSSSYSAYDITNSENITADEYPVELAHDDENKPHEE